MQTNLLLYSSLLDLSLSNRISANFFYQKLFDSSRLLNHESIKELILFWKLNNKNKNGKKLTPEIIHGIVMNYYDLENDNKKCRKRQFVKARQIAHYFSKKLINESLTKIGFKIGNKDHATVSYSCRVVNDMLDTDNRLRSEIYEIERIIKNYC